MNSIDSTVAVITGGSSGIGKALAKECLQKGYNVVIGARRKDVLKRCEAELSTYAGDSGAVSSCVLDVSDEKSIIRFAYFCNQKYGKIDLLFNCAGIAVCKEFERTSSAEFTEVAAIDYAGTALMVKYSLPLLQKSGKGHIVAVSSMAGVMGVYGYSAYSPAKYAVVGFAEVLRAELIPHGIAVSLVLPADTQTPQFVAENATKPEITKRISGTIKPMSAEKAAKCIMKGLAKKRFLIIPGFMSKFIYHINRLFPNLMYAYSKRVIQKYLKRNSKKR
ncbi:SDR family oxidoreductase [Treponema maltophilum]|uniref:SDR family oxidoreductase n=1 Tax=Treponema maltophilum TaxID=51160 RepID=UPI003D8E2E07